jgi:tetratricopeptide (TPR) repeat protein
MTTEPAQLADQGKTAFVEKRFVQAAELFKQAADGFTQNRNVLMTAEMNNNMSVALLQAGNAQGALDAAMGTDEVFAGANDLKRQAIALANQAAALEELDRPDDAIEKYERSADLFRAANEGDMRATVMKSVAAIKLKKGRVSESAFKMMGALEAKDRPSFFDRILKFFLRFIK